LVSSLAPPLQAILGFSRRRLGHADRLSIAVAVVLAGGAILRIRAYAADRSLWLDESFLALNLLRRGWSGLLGQLDFNQGAAPGFLLLEKGAASVSTGELALRGFPFALGLATLALIAPVARRVCSPAGTLLACGLTALAPSMIYYSTELKQYSGDVTASLILLWAGLELRGGASRRRTSIAATAGTLAILISQAAVFTAAGVGAVLLAADIFDRRRRPARATVAPVGIWAAASAIVLVHALHASAGVLRSYEGSAALAGPGGGGGSTSTHSISLLATSIAGDLGLPTTALSIKLITYVVGIFGIAGLVSLLRRRTWPALMVAAPAALMLGASMLGRYPISGRTVLFVAPMAAVLVAEGIALAVRSVPLRFGVVLGLALAVLALEGAVRADTRTLVHPTKREEVRTVLSSVAAMTRPGDRIFVAYAAQYALAYYAECRCVGAAPWHPVPARGGQGQWAPAIRSDATVEVQPYLGRDDTAYLESLRRLQPGRTWVLLSHVSDAREKTFLYEDLLDVLDRRGRRIETVRAPGALAVLYDLD
jgi:hypothetical protein